MFFSSSVEIMGWVAGPSGCWRWKGLVSLVFTSALYFDIGAVQAKVVPPFGKRECFS